jgi:hypothetical protein
MLRVSRRAVLLLTIALVPWACLRADNGRPGISQAPEVVENLIRGEEHYATRDGLHIYLWEKRSTGLKESIPSSGKVALLRARRYVVGTPRFRPADSRLFTHGFSRKKWFRCLGH